MTDRTFPLVVRQGRGYTEVTCSGEHVTVLVECVSYDAGPGMMRDDLRELIDHARTCPANIAARLEAERLRPHPSRALKGTNPE